MPPEEISFLPYETALQLVGAIQEEEHPRENNRRVFTVYDRNNRELCWFDADETIAELTGPVVKPPRKEELQPKLEAYILNHIPEWVLD